ncbi:peptidase [Pseudogulbenkiania sp. MAI-1]|uniref:peptidase n=1 Tax=Pseudogulbenkiania sp. MAI-1 TaxID=990370 RepID=UPI00045EC1A9|nr:peptidase [Pseudogulbenkiania sp. MAI-1]
MTYCVAIRLESGLIFASDSRTNAGVDNIATFQKMHTFDIPGRLRLVMMTSGNLATSQSVASLLDLKSRQDGPGSLCRIGSLYDAAVLVGQTLREVIARDGGGDGPVDLGSCFLLGGQLAGERPRLFNIYPQGNFIEATADTPYFQIGETKYGKPILDRVLNYRSSLEEAIRCALISLDSTMRSNLSVALPIHLMWHRNDDFTPRAPRCIGEDDGYFRELRAAWGRGIKDTFAALPATPWHGELA